jgi:hypothetical protein
MALISKNPDDYEPIRPPHDLESWYKVRPIAGGDLKKLGLDKGEVVISLDLLAELLIAWSHPEPLTLENIDRLDLDTTLWLASQIKTASNIREPEQLASLGDGSSPTSDPAMEPSLQSSGIS